MFQNIFQFQCNYILNVFCVQMTLKKQRINQILSYKEFFVLFFFTYKWLKTRWIWCQAMSRHGQGVGVQPKTSSVIENIVNPPFGRAETPLWKISNKNPHLTLSRVKDLPWPCLAMTVRDKLHVNRGMASIFYRGYRLVFYKGIIWFFTGGISSSNISGGYLCYTPLSITGLWPKANTLSVSLILWVMQ